jgi:hypothetical protein
LREGGRKGLEIIAASNNIGSAAVASHTLKALPAKLKTAWRPIMSRIQILNDLVSGISVVIVIIYYLLFISCLYSLWIRK